MPQLGARRLVGNVSSDRVSKKLKKTVKHTTHKSFKIFTIKKLDVENERKISRNCEENWF